MGSHCRPTWGQQFVSERPPLSQRSPTPERHVGGIVHEYACWRPEAASRNGLPLLGDGSLFVLNGDGLWRDGPHPRSCIAWNFRWDPALMDAVRSIHPQGHRPRRGRMRTWPIFSRARRLFCAIAGRHRSTPYISQGIRSASAPVPELATTGVLASADLEPRRVD